MELELQPIIDGDSTFRLISQNNIQGLSINLDQLYGSLGGMPFLWGQLQQTTHRVTALLQLTLEAAKAFGFHTRGLLEGGYESDLVLFKIQPFWQMHDRGLDIHLESFLYSLFCQSGPQHVAAVFKKGRLIHADGSFMDKFQQASMGYYYEHDNIPTSIDMGHRFNSIEQAIQAFQRGEFVVAVDNEDRENEGDLIIPGQDLTPEKAAFMIRYTSGVICAPCEGYILDRLEIPMMVERNEDSLKTAYTVSVDATASITFLLRNDYRNIGSRSFFDY